VLAAKYTSSDINCDVDPLLLTHVDIAVWQAMKKDLNLEEVDLYSGYHPSLLINGKLEVLNVSHFSSYTRIIPEETLLWDCGDGNVIIERLSFEKFSSRVHGPNIWYRGLPNTHEVTTSGGTVVSIQHEIVATKQPSLTCEKHGCTNDYYDSCTHCCGAYCSVHLILRAHVCIRPTDIVIDSVSPSHGDVSTVKSRGNSGATPGNNVTTKQPSRTCEKHGCRSDLCDSCTFCFGGYCSVHLTLGEHTCIRLTEIVMNNVSRSVGDVSTMESRGNSGADKNLTTKQPSLTCEGHDGCERELYNICKFCFGAYCSVHLSLREHACCILPTDVRCLIDIVPISFDDVSTEESHDKNVTTKQPHQTCENHGCRSDLNNLCRLCFGAYCSVHLPPREHVCIRPTDIFIDNVSPNDGNSSTVGSRGNSGATPGKNVTTKQPSLTCEKHGCRSDFYDSCAHCFGAYCSVHLSLREHVCIRQTDNVIDSVSPSHGDGSTVESFPTLTEDDELAWASTLESLYLSTVNDADVQIPVAGRVARLTAFHYLPENTMQRAGHLHVLDNLPHTQAYIDVEESVTLYGYASLL